MSATVDDLLEELQAIQKELQGLRRPRGGVQLTLPYEGTIAAVAQDHAIPTPPGTRFVQVRFVATGSPTNGIQGFVSTGTPWPETGSSSGFAYDAKSGKYTGAALRAEEVISLDMHHTGGMVHVASRVNATPFVINFFGSYDDEDD